MKTQRKVLAIIYAPTKRGPRFLIFHRILRWRGWELLKETLRPGETARQALKRGIKEETKFSKFTIVKKLPYEFSWNSKNTRYKVIAAYVVRLSRCKRPNLAQKVREHDGFRWATKEKATQMLTFKNTKSLLTKRLITELPKDLS